MLVLTFQVAVAALALAFALVAVAVARAAARGRPLHHRAWIVTAAAFLLGGISSVAQNVFAVAAVRAGQGSAAWDAFLVWAPIGNYGRVCLKISMALLLAALPWLDRVPTRRLALCAAGVFAAMLVGGGVLGWQEGALREAIHYPGYAVFETGELLALLLALFVAVVSGTMDRWLWAALAVYAFRQALNVLSWTALAWWGSGQWTLNPLYLHAGGVIGYLAMIAVALHRLARARRNPAEAPGMFDAPRRELSFLH